MTAKDWLEKNADWDMITTVLSLSCDQKKEISKWMERYANEVSKEYQAKILMFSTRLKYTLALGFDTDIIREQAKDMLKTLENSLPDIGELDIDPDIQRVLDFYEKESKKEHPLVEQYNEFFGITTQRKGEIVNENRDNSKGSEGLLQ